MSIQKLHYENISGTLVRREGLLSWRCPLCKAEGQSPGVMRTCPECGSKEATLPGAQQCKNCNGTGSRFDPSGEKIPCDLCESHLEEIRSLVAEAAHDIVSGSDFWLSISLAAKKIYALPGAKGEEK